MRIMGGEFSISYENLWTFEPLWLSGKEKYMPQRL